MGIDDAYIDELVESFYARVRRDAVLGPIFDEAIADAWPTHLALMKDFWASVAFNAGRYSGKPVPAHQKLVRIEPGHFGRWLDLFGKTLEDTAPTAAAVDYFMERAARIAESLRLAMFGSAATAARR
ncbi:MAG: group III truncated hemoglobin [Hyphomicrobiales bacterium]|nr:group III truncated hemoglobin [Hyphomicrobiales bacterium]